MLAELHLALMVVTFVWNAIKAYEQTPQGNQEYADILDVLQAVENPGSTPPNSAPSGTSSRPENKLGLSKVN